jgi:ParB-like chromosome segregation protein Spo0J
MANDTHNLPRHPACLIFPRATDDEVRRLSDDIEKRGQLEDIVVHNDQVLDGDARLRALKLLNRPVKVKRYDGSDPWGEAWALNALRRQLTVSQTAMALAGLPRLPRGRPAKNTARAGISAEQLAEKHNISADTLGRARTVMDKGVPELVEAVKADAIDVNNAALLTRLPAEEQRTLVLSGPAAIKKKGQQLRRGSNDKLSNNKPNDNSVGKEHSISEWLSTGVGLDDDQKAAPDVARDFVPEEEQPSAGKSLPAEKANSRSKKSSAQGARPPTIGDVWQAWNTSMRLIWIKADMSVRERFIRELLQEQDALDGDDGEGGVEGSGDHALSSNDILGLRQSSRTAIASCSARQFDEHALSNCNLDLPDPPGSACGAGIGAVRSALPPGVCRTMNATTVHDLKREAIGIGVTKIAKIKTVLQRQENLLRRLDSAKLADAFAGLRDCNVKECGLVKCHEVCRLGAFRRRLENVLAARSLLRDSPDRLYEIVAAPTTWARPIGELTSIDVQTVRAWNRRRLNELYEPDLIGVGMVKVALATSFTGEVHWVAFIHEVVAGADRSTLIDAMGDRSRKRHSSPYRSCRYPIRVLDVADLPNALDRVFDGSLRGHVPEADHVINKVLQAHRIEHDQWLKAVPAGGHTIRYGCDARFNKLTKKPRSVVIREVKKRPYPIHLIPYQFGGDGRWRDREPGGM